MINSIKVKNDNYKFKYRVSGLLIKDDKVLVTEMNNSGFYCLPGGYVELGENSKEAIIREMAEEVKYKVKLVKSFAVVENFFINKNNIKMQEIAIYYLFDLNENIELKDYTFEENDNSYIINHNFKWIDINELENINFKPREIISKIKNKDYTYEHMIINTI